MTAALTQIVRVPDDVLFRELQGEAVILSLSRSTYYGLDAVGTRIWQLCEAHGLLQAVFDAMQREFDAPGEMLEADLLTFVDDLLARGLLAIQ
jgi:hypothetical protein